MADTDTASADGADPVKKPGRAGRNLPAAIGVGAFLGFGVIAILVFTINALVDLSFRFLDPRLRSKGT